MDRAGDRRVSSLPGMYFYYCFFPALLTDYLLGYVQCMDGNYECPLAPGQMVCVTVSRPTGRRVFFFFPFIINNSHGF